MSKLGLLLGLPGYGGGGAATLPEGAIGSWSVANYTTTPRRVIPNSATQSAVSANLFGMPRRAFNDTAVYTKTSVTVTDKAVDGPDGGANQASTVVSTATNWSLSTINTGNVPAGTYTLAVWAKSNSGSDEFFAFTKDNLTTRSSVKTATTTWQRFTYTFTLASPVAANSLKLCSSDGSTGASLQICDYELFSGSSDLGETNGTVPAGHLYVGAASFTATPAVADGELNLSAGGFGQIQFASNRNISDGITYVCLTRKVATGTSFNATLSKVTDYNDITFTEDQALKPQIYMNAAKSFSQYAGLWEFINKNYFVHTYRYDGTNTDRFLNDSLIHRHTGSVANKTYADFFVGIVASGALSAGHKMVASALWGTALSDSEVLQAVAYMQAQAAAASVTLGTERVMCFEGDSISSNNAADTWPYVYGASSSPSILGHNFAVSGSSITNLESRAATVDLVLPSELNGRLFLLSVLIGANDLDTLGAATWLTNLRSYLVDRKAAGWTIALCTPTPRTHAGFTTQRAAALPTMRGWEGDGVVDYLIDFAADATMGPDAAASDTLLYSDGTHPTTLGQQNLAAIAATVLDAI